MAKIYIFGKGGRENFIDDEDDAMTRLSRALSTGVFVMLAGMIAGVSCALAFFLGLFL